MVSPTPSPPAAPVPPPETEIEPQTPALAAATDIASEVAVTDVTTEAAVPATTRTGLWANQDFLKLWAGQSLSLFGSQVTIYALPLVAVVILNASPTQMGLLGGLARAPFVLFLFAGVWADRYRRRPTMIWTDLGRGVLVALLPIAWFAGVLNLVWLYVVAVLVGILGVFFEVANQAFLPSLVGKEHIAEGNAKMQISTSVAQVAGPSLGAGLLAIFSAASLIIADAVSYFVSGIASLMIRRPEERPGGGGRNPHVFAAMGAGIKWVLGQRLIRPMLIATTLFMLFGTGIQVQYVLYARRTLGLSPQLIAVTLAFLGVGAIVGSTLSLKVLRRIGPGPAAFWSITLGNIVYLLIPVASGPIWLKVIILSAAQAIAGAFAPISMVGMGSLRMHLTPNDMQGRVVATFRGLSLGLAPVGALLSGFLAAGIGLRPTMYILAIGILIPPVVIALSPIPGTRKFPAPPGDAA
jgi:MFS family permease